MVTRGLGFLLLISLAVFGAACSDEAGGTSSTPVSVRAAIDAIRSGDAGELASQAQFVTIGCTTADGLGGPPKCEPGQPEGAQVEVLPAAACEGYYIKPAETSGSFEGFLDGDIEMAAAYRTEASELFPAGYMLTMRFSDAPVPEHGRALFLDERGITGVFLGCGHTLEQLKTDWTTGEVVWEP